MQKLKNSVRRKIRSFAASQESKATPPCTTHVPDVQLEEHQYKPLEAQQIRLLYLKVGTGDTDDIKCGLLHVELPGRAETKIPFGPDRSAIEYSAISYAWEQEDDPVSIRTRQISFLSVERKDNSDDLALNVSGAKTVISVSESMWKMIRHILGAGIQGRQSGDEERERRQVFWIDQICIDQSNPVEKATQVRLMHEIFYWAKSTLIYLGEPSNSTNLSFQLIRALSAMKDDPRIRAPKSMDDEERLQRSEIDWDAILPGGNIKPDPFTIFARDILGRRWFTRTWVVQEIATSAEAHVLCGTNTVSWDDLVEACHVAMGLGVAFVFGEHTICERLGSMIERNRRTYLNWRNYGSLLGSDYPEIEQQLYGSLVCRSFGETLPMFVQQGVTDPRDKVFAMLNIVSENSDGIGNQIIDYTLSIRQVYFRATELWHTQGKLLRRKVPFRLAGRSYEDISFLDWVVDPKQNEDLRLPSWIPTWNSPFGSDFVVLTSSGAANKIEPRVTFPSALPSSAEDIPLIVGGAHVLTIKSTCYAFTFGSQGGLDLPLEKHADMLNSFTGQYPTTTETYMNAYRNTMFPEDTLFSCRSQRTCTFWESRQYSSNLPESSYSARDLRDELPMHMWLPWTNHTFKALAANRILFTTDEGFIGLGPQEMQPKDIVCLFFGGAPLYILRELNQGRYKFVGACFVYSIMSGETLIGMPIDRINDFVLV